MRGSTDLDGLGALEQLAPDRNSTYGEIPIVILQYEAAGNDATCEDPAVSKDDVEPWTQHTLPERGTGNVAFTVTASPERPTTYELHQAARARRPFMLGQMIIAAIRAAGATARRAHARYCQRRDARAAYDALRHLDGRTLRDLGFDRSEITSVAAEVTGGAERTRIRILLGD